jgi:hypothetical protein
LLGVAVLPVSEITKYGTFSHCFALDVVANRRTVAVVEVEVDYLIGRVELRDGGRRERPREQKEVREFKAECWD